MARRVTGRTTTRRVAATLAALVAALLAPPPAQAAPTWLLPPTFIAGDSANTPQIGVTPAGDAVVAYLRVVDGFSIVHAATRKAGGAWTSPVPISAPGVNATDPRLVVDSAGNATAAWRSAAGTVTMKASFLPAGGTWQQPTDLSPAGMSATNPDIAVDAAGTVTVVWSLAGSGTRIVQSVERPVNGVWSAPQERSVGDAGYPSVAAGPAGNVVIVYQRAANVGYVIDGTVRDAAGTWSTPVPLSADTLLAETPRAAMDGTGRAIAAWTEYEATNTRIQTAEHPAGGGWTSAVDQSEAGRDAQGPFLDANAAGGAVLGWFRSDGSVVRAQVTSRLPGGAWEAPVTLSDAGSDGVTSAVGIGPSGDRLVAWSYGSGTSRVVQVSTRGPTGSWSAPQTLTPGAVESYSPGAGIDAGGDVAVALQVGGVPTSVQVAALDAAGPAVTAFTAPSTGTAGQAVGFGAAATDVWSAVTSYAWSFGDGGTAAGPNVSHTFAQPGSYPVTLTVTDAVGNATSRTATTTVAAPVPVIGTFKLTKNKILAPARAVPKKTRLKVGLNTAATLKLVFQSKHKHLVNGKKKHLKVVLRTSLPAGLSKVTIKATVKGKLLKPDTYRLTGVAKNATGKSPRKTTKLVVVRRP